MNMFEPFADRAAPVAAGLGTLHGVGLGPGDPDLLTVRAVRIIQAAPVVAFFAKRGRRGVARDIVDPWLSGHAEELPLLYPMTTERHFADPVYVAELGSFYEEAREILARRLATGLDVALLCEGDPLLYGSFMHLFVRLRDRFEVAITAGISGMSGCWNAAGVPMTWGDDVLTVVPGTLEHHALVERLRLTDAAVVMKLGSNFPKVRAAVAEAGLLDRAIYVERGTMPGERIVPLREMTDDRAPYFSMVLVPGNGRRP